MWGMPHASYEDKARAEWRELGFYYSRDNAAKEWHLVVVPTKVVNR
jgi:DICT domain-containing protein